MGIADTLTHELLAIAGENNVLRELFRRTLDPKLFVRLAALDQRLTDDKLTSQLGWALCNRIYSDGLVFVGELVQLDEVGLRPLLGVENEPFARLKAVLARDGLALGDDTTVWRHYRLLVPPFFQLFDSESALTPPQGIVLREAPKRACCDLVAARLKGRA